MERVQVTQHRGYACNLWVTEQMKRIVNAVEDNKFTFSVDLIDVSYHLTAQERAMGPRGWCGPIVDDPAKGKPNYQEHNEVFHIAFTLAPDFSKMAKLEEYASEITVTPQGTPNRPALKFLTHTLVYNYIDVTTTKYHYKHPKFNQALQAMREINPNLTEDKFANYDYSNLIIVTENESPDHEVYKTEIINRKEQTDLLYYKMVLNIIATDIERNFDIIMKIINMV